jgi:hypothetical protein
MADVESLGAFYLGRRVDPATGRTLPDPVLYDARDLTTHAVCLGMTGSGKTGLCLGLLEEAALDGVPAIAIDPKGDVGNLLLTFPELRAADFRPWVDEDEARRAGRSAEEAAEQTAAAWREGLASWGQDTARIARLRNAADFAIYTPGSDSGLSLSVLRSFSAPPPSLRDVSDALRERIEASVSGLLDLLGIRADPLQSREHILLATLFERAWRGGEDLDLAALVPQVQSPPVARIGVLDLESFYPEKERRELALRLNGLIASPSFEVWTRGEPLDVARLLWTPEGRPRLSVVSIAHLGDAERMFFVTLLLNEMVSWMRAQPGTPSLRAILYMDEIFGFFPPSAAPPSKRPMLTLLKQARAFGLGVVLASQNPVDLDYKGLANAGTWFLGRLQTERDRERVLDGLEGIAAGAWDRAAISTTLAGLRKRVFLLHDVHAKAPILFETRWTMSYLRGPLTREQIATLMSERKSGAAETPAAAPVAAPAASVTGESSPPPLPFEIPQRFAPAGGKGFLFRPHLFGRARLRYVSTTLGVDREEAFSLLAPLDETTGAAPWEAARPAPEGAEAWPATVPAGARFAALPKIGAPAKRLATWTRALGAHLYRTRALVLWQHRALGVISKPEESEGDFRVRAQLVARERRDREVAKLRQRYATKLATLRTRLERTRQRVEREKQETAQQGVQTAISVGATVLGAILGRKAISSGTVGRATTAARGVGRIGREQADVARAQESAAEIERQIADIEAELEAAANAIAPVPDPTALELEAVPVRPRQADIVVEEVAIVWVAGESS